MHNGSDKFSIEKLVPNPSPESMLSFIQEIVRTSQLESTKWRNIQFATPDDEKAFHRHFEFWGENTEIRRTAIGECRCNDNAHNRFSKGNSRRKIENSIMEGISNLENKDSITLLSVGSGKFLQDLILLFRLVLKGYKKITITCIEPDLNNEAYEHFMTIIDAVNQYYKTEIVVHYHKSIAEIPNETRSFDVVYGIDYDNLEFGKDHSSRKLEKREGTFNDATYIAAMDMIKALSFLNQEKGAFGAYSQHKNIYLFSDSNPDITSTTTIENTVFSPNTFEEYCINSSLEVLLANLSFFIKEQKPLLINEEIIQELDKPFLETMLKNFNIPYSFFIYAQTKANTFTDNTLRLVVDWIAFDTKKGEKPDITGFEGHNNSIMRVDYCNNRSMTTTPGQLGTQILKLCGGRPGITQFLGDYLLKLGFEEAQNKINEWKNQAVVFHAKFLGQIAQTQLDDIIKNADDTVSKILTTPCYTSVDYNTGFFETEDTLQSYLEELLAFPNFPKITIVKYIIQCLEDKEYAEIPEYLLKTEKGRMIWNSILEQNPEIIGSSDNTANPSS